MNIPVQIEVSARHVHLSQKDQDILFGPGYEMKIMKQLSQTGQWAAEEKVTVKGTKGEVQCRVLGPCRKQTQVELAFSDAFRIGTDAAIRISDDLKGSGACTLTGPKGSVELTEGVINDLRHLHISDKEAAQHDIKHGQKVSVYFGGPQSITFNEVHVRVDPSFRMNVHLDTDEGNACSLPRGGQGFIIGPSPENL